MDVDPEVDVDPDGVTDGGLRRFAETTLSSLFAFARFPEPSVNADLIVRRFNCTPHRKYSPTSTFMAGLD